MKTIDWKYTSVGQIVADDFAAASVFKKYGIDFCCHGEVTLEKACADLGLAVEEVEQALLRQDEAGNGRIPFASWPLDLLMDYILKIHHRGIRARGPELLALLEKVERVHGEAHPELHELKALVSESLEDLEMHLQKEENVLFPYLRSKGTGTAYGPDALRYDSESYPGDEDGTRGRRKPLPAYYSVDESLLRTSGRLCQLPSADAGTGSVCGCVVRAYPPGKQSAVPPL